MSTNNTTRRAFISNTAKVGIGAMVLPGVLQSCGNNAAVALPTVGFQQAALPYAYNALEPVIDAATMELHYTKHAASYASNLKAALEEENVDVSKNTLENILATVSKYSTKMRNNAGGHYNHELFWQMMRPAADQNAPAGDLLAAIEHQFNSFDAFKSQFTEAAKSTFGSGWAWLIIDGKKQLQITSTPNQDNPLMDVAAVKGTPLLGLDVWEHAYYLNYQNRRPEYIEKWWSLVNWDYVASRYAAVK
ncbi:superoxide dismutase [Gynurincola endophyticus]|nr:superoxide dismutase [Gynurincola endophyticus]